MISTDSRSTPRDEATHMPNRNRGPQDPAKPRVLVVDDEDDLLELVRYNLAKDGYDVECVGSGEQALQSARTNPPDLVVLDLMLPAVDGLEVCRRLKTDPKTRDILIVMLTAKGEESDMVAGLERGADDYIAKPFSPRVLSARCCLVRLVARILFLAAMWGRFGPPRAYRFGRVVEVGVVAGPRAFSV